LLKSFYPTVDSYLHWSLGGLPWSRAFGVIDQCYQSSVAKQCESVTPITCHPFASALYAFSTVQQSNIFFRILEAKGLPHAILTKSSVLVMNCMRLPITGSFMRLLKGLLTIGILVSFAKDCKLTV
jgi:hypothetical protein